MFTADRAFSRSLRGQMKKKKRPARTTSVSASLGTDGDEGSNEMQVDEPAAPRQIERASLDSSNLIDDDDLAVSLARQRREAAKRQIKEMKERARLQVEETTKVKEEDRDGEEDVKPATVKEEEARDGDGDDVLVMDDTSEFVRNIKVAAEEAASRPARKASVVPKVENGGQPDLRGLESTQPRIKLEEGEEDMVPLSEMEIGGSNGNGRGDDDGDAQMMQDGNEDGQVDETEEKKPKVNHDDDEEFGTTGEKLVSKGLASTLSILRHQGLMKPRTAEEIRKEKEFKEREAWLVAQRKRDEERERERIESRNAGDKKDQRQREYENKLRDQRDAQAAMEAYKNYKPVVELKYHDEFGRDMTPKEVCWSLCVPFPFDRADPLCLSLSCRRGSICRIRSTATVTARRRRRSDC